MEATAQPAQPAQSTPPVGLQGRARIFSWIGQLVAAVILLQTLFFKFTAAPEAVAIFEKLGVEPFGRIGLGIAELIAGVMLLTPRLAALGGLLTVGMMVGAIGSHLTVLGIEHEGDGGALFAMAWIALLGAGVTVWLRIESLLALLPGSSKGSDS